MHRIYEHSNSKLVYYYYTLFATGMEKNKKVSIEIHRTAKPLNNKLSGWNFIRWFFSFSLSFFHAFVRQRYSITPDNYGGGF